jgi:hypothetical protein
MAERSNDEIVHAYMKAMTDDDRDTLGRLRHQHWTLDYPQSGERIRSHADEVEIATHYPGGLPEVGPERVVGSEDHWVVTPSFTFERIVGSGDSWWVEGRAQYPDGSTWLLVTILDLRDGQVLHETTYWAEPFDPPAWRAAWVEVIQPG